MSSLFTNLLFLHGHIADPALARRLAETPSPTPRQKGKRERSQSMTKSLQKTLAPQSLAHGGCG
jgi:hypothetical protein